jgi:2-oxoglutarate ferredoxin oxidoreductase subunit beta
MSFYETCETAWCPGCGNFVILECLKEALERLGKKPHEVLLAAGIGQAAKTPQYLSANAFCGLHGRALPAAVAAKIANANLTVVVDTGDGDSYGEGGNHFLHNLRRNVDIAHFVHDNQVYGLTKGQASPTSDLGFVTGVQTGGSINHPLNPVLTAIAAGAGFVARGFTGHKEQLIDLMMAAISHKGYALVDILQPCVSFNKVNTFQWYSKRVYDLADHDPSDRELALRRASEFGDRIPLGILYRMEKPSYHDRNPALHERPLAGREPNLALVDRLIHSHQ